jgi:predicted transposase YbfD/YdcC
MPKKTVQLLVDKGNDYVVGVKANQPKLVAQFEAALADARADSISTSVDNTHGRQVERTVKIFAAPVKIAQLWHGASSLVVVHRHGCREGEVFERTSFYLSSLSVSALEMGLGIRGHRDIENGLHWVRDVVFNEDAAPFAQLTPATNWSVMRSIAINLFRCHGYSSLTRAIRLFAHDLPKLISLLKTN